MIESKSNCYPYEFWTSTSGNLGKKRTQMDTPKYTKDVENITKIIIDPSLKKNNWIGVGAAITDSTACLLWTSMDKQQRSKILHELFDPQEGGFSVIRLPLGSCDFSSQDYYTYDDVPYGQHDSKLLKFSIGEGKPGTPEATKDLKYIVPVVQEILKINPAVKIVASPWSAPAWMKNTGKLEYGGHLRFGEYTGNGYDKHKDTFEGIYANYFVKYIEEYQKLGIPIYGVTVQNEPSNAAHWPAMLWTMQQQAEFASDYLRYALDRKFPDTRIFILDDSLHAIDRPIAEQVTDQQASNISGLALHTYQGPFANLYNVNRRFPNWQFMMSERRCMMKETPEDAAHIMFGTIGNFLVRHGVNMITLWNLALDERGLPNAADSKGRRGVITVDHKTGKVKRNLEYYMLRNFGQDVTVGSQMIESSNYTVDGVTGGLGSVAFEGKDGSISAHLYNPTSKEIMAAVTISGADNSWQLVSVPAWGTVTLKKSCHKFNTSTVPEDDEFTLNPTRANNY